MSQILIQQYLNQLRDLRRVGGTYRETVVREAFKDLLKGWARQHDLIFVPEYQFVTPARDRRVVDGALLHTLRVPFGFWEAKDEKDDLDTEIATKLRRGYPQDNIVFEDSVEAVLIQARTEVMRCRVDDVERLEKLLGLFFSYTRPEVAQFRQAVEQFKGDLPQVLSALRDMIEAAHAENAAFREASSVFLEHVRDTINPSLTAADVREMLIQHVLTEEIFAAVFPGTPFHQDNNVARELYKLEATFFTGNTKFQILKGLQPYYGAIRSTAAQIATHHEKETFLKSLYEGFYRVYNPKAADRLGVVYTPSEIVRFMIESTDRLCERHFGRHLIERDVEILDPAAGTGTFVCELLEHFRGQPEKLRHKYREELHANEVAILPYYVANLNVEATYAAITGEYEEFPNLCFVDTLDNVGGHTAAVDSQGTLFGGVTEENVARIRRQNSRRISVILGNPPYNANQLNENENNKNREYPEIDRRIKVTYIAESTAQKTKLYDMYARFFRWASDRLAPNGVLAFITNRSFIDGRTFDGFRKVVAKEFSEIRVVDLGGDVRANPKLSGTKHNVFGIQTGVAISFLVKREGADGRCRIFYTRRPEFETAEEKLAFLGNARIDELPFKEVTPSARGNWINLASTDFESLIPVASRAAKASRSEARAEAIFRMFASGIKTNRDDWVYDFSDETLARKAEYLSRKFLERQGQGAEAEFEVDIKWSGDLKRKALRNDVRLNSEFRSVLSLWRPFVRKYYWTDKVFSDRLTDLHYSYFGDTLLRPNQVIAFLCVYSSNPLAAMATEGPFDYCLLKRGNGGTESVARWTWDENGQRRDNITDWALDQFQDHYRSTDQDGLRPITKEAIFHYVYAVLHDPVYREKYALDLRRSLPRVPFYPDFWRWAEWGRALMELHVRYETVARWALVRTDVPDESSRRAGVAPKAILRADKVGGRIVLDGETTLGGVPVQAWEYRIANRSAIEWVLDQYKEKKPRDPTIRDRFDTYRFSDHKEEVIELLGRVVAVSVETVRIVGEMSNARRR